MRSELQNLYEIYVYSQDEPKTISDEKIHIYPDVESVLANIKSEKSVIFTSDGKDIYPLYGYIFAPIGLTFAKFDFDTQA